MTTDPDFKAAVSFVITCQKRCNVQDRVTVTVEYLNRVMYDRSNYVISSDP